MSHETPRSLDLIRADIESVDAQVVRLLAERAKLAQEVGEVKGLDGQPYF
ncbi:chorismate mutase, partial [Klebsiella pneumoniae]